MAESMAQSCFATFLQPFSSAVAACLAPLNEKIAESARARLFLGQNRRRLRDAQSELKAMADYVKEKVEDEEAQLRICNPAVRDWQNKVEKSLEKALVFAGQPEDPPVSACLCSGCKLAREVMRTLRDVEELIRKVGDFNDQFTRLPPPETEDQLSMKTTFGMESFLEQLRSHFHDKEQSVIGVYGLGGVGKTTLLKKFSKEVKQKNGDVYKMVIVIEVANKESLNVVEMQRRVANRLGLWNPNELEDDRAGLLLRALRKKRFVVMLDDVWDKFELEKVGIPNPNSDNGSKLIVASRSNGVCAHMGAKESIEMHCLDKEQSWKLFLSNLTAPVHAAINKNNEMKRDALKIVEKCGGLPLAINAIGSALACQKNPEQWRSLKKAMVRNPARIAGVGEMLDVLKYSYDMLEEAEKKCFLYSTLFPDYGSIKCALLLDYWVAEGLVAGGSDLYEGFFMISKLLSACLLQNSDTEPSEVNMHQMIRRMGHRQADSQQEKFLIKAGQALRQAPGEQEWTDATRISLMSNYIGELNISPDCRKLRTLLLQNNPHLRQLGPKFFRHMPSLKVLDLSQTAIADLPGCDPLVQLTYLNLSHTRIKEFPKKLCSTLTELLYLNMSNTLIRELPKDLSRLKKLTHLYLRETSELKVIPNSTISKLFCLRVLDLYKSKYGVRDPEDLNLENLHELENLGITIYSQDVLGKLKKTDPLARSTHCLSLSHCSGMQSIQLSEFRRMKHLEELHIHSCNELEELFVDHVGMEGSVKSLEVLTLASLPHLAGVLFGAAAAPHRFHDLRELAIRSCHILKHVSWVLQLESLEKLVIEQCDGLEELLQEEPEGIIKTNLSCCEIEVKEENSNHSMNLRMIDLKDLIKLKRICRRQSGYFPCLESIRVEKCPNLEELPVGGIPKLKQICGETDWWAEMITQEMKNELGDCFVPI